MDYRDPGVVLLCGVLTFAGLAISPGNGQTLKKRGGILTPQLQRIYDSADFKTAYQVAETTYNASTPHPFRPYLWDQKKPLSWIGYKQNEFGRYTLDFEVLEDQLDAVCNDSQVTNNPEKVAQISQIQDRLTEDSLKALNAMVTAVDLRTLFISNNKKENHGPVDAAIASLYDSLHQAQQAAAKEGLLDSRQPTVSAGK